MIIEKGKKMERPINHLTNGTNGNANYVGISKKYSSRVDSTLYISFGTIFF